MSGARAREDHFSGVAEAYAACRPPYPAELFDWLAEEAPARTLAWDCACGSGQASGPLAARFRKVVATDASRAQLRAAPEHPGVHRLVAAAEAVPLREGVADLVVVAQALHWLDAAAFHAEARRVARPGALLAAWCYGLNRLPGQPEAERRFREWERSVIAAWWPPRRRLVDEGYRTIRFPLPELPTPDFRMRAAWSLDAFLGYLGSWSAVARMRRASGRDPLPALRARLAPHWGPSRRPVEWPLHLRVGRLGQPS